MWECRLRSSLDSPDPCDLTQVEWLWGFKHFQVKSTQVNFTWVDSMLHLNQVKRPWNTVSKDPHSVRGDLVTHLGKTQVWMVPTWVSFQTFMQPEWLESEPKFLTWVRVPWLKFPSLQTTAAFLAFYTVLDSLKLLLTLTTQASSWT